MPRQARKYSETGVYHIMLRGNERKNIFIDDEDKGKFIEILFKKKETVNFFLYCYCIMDNHVHLVIKEQDDTISQIIKRIATSYAYYFNKKYKRVGHVFQDRFKSEAIETEVYLLAVIRYIHKNPEKAGLCKVGEYRWSSYNRYVNVNNDLPEVNEILELFSNNLIKAKRLFEQFSINTAEEKVFLDIDEESEIDESNFLKYFNRLMKEQEIASIEELKEKENKVPREFIIKELADKSNLSLRKIADLSGLNREMVRKITSKVSKEPSP